MSQNSNYVNISRTILAILQRDWNDAASNLPEISDLTVEGLGGRTVLDAVGHLSEGEVEPSMDHLNFVKTLLNHPALQTGSVKDIVESAAQFADLRGNSKVAIMLRQAKLHR